MNPNQADNETRLRAEKSYSEQRKKESQPGYHVYSDPEYDASFDIENRGLIFTPEQKMSAHENVCIGSKAGCICQVCQDEFTEEFGCGH